MSTETESAAPASESSYDFLKEDWSSDWKPHRDFLGISMGILIANGPGLFWLYIFVDALRSAESTAFWYGQTPTGELSVVAQYGIAIVLAVLWFGVVLALFKQPLKKSIGELRG